MSRRFDFITILLVLLNIIGFGYNYMVNGAGLITNQVTSQQYLNVGAMNGDSSLLTWVTSIFQHASPIHILMNMLSLIALAPAVILIFNRFWYLIGYLASGLIASFSNAIFAPDTVTLGASGAICGLMGMLVIGSLFSYNKDYVDFKEIITAVLFMIIATLSNPTVSVTGHFGGFVGGLIVGLILVIGQRLFMSKPEEEDDLI